MIAEFVLTILQKPPSAERQLRPAIPLEFGVSGSVLGQMERELVQLHRDLAQYVVQVRLTFPGPSAATSEESAVSREFAFSGIVVDRKGLLLAPGPPQMEAAKITVIRFDGYEFPAQRLAWDNELNLWLLEAPGLNIRPPPLARCAALPVGTLTFAIGNSFETLKGTFSMGFISGKHRRVGNAQDLIQISNPVNPGDGGGLVADRHGRVIGIIMTSLRQVGRWGQEPGKEHWDPQGMSSAEGLAFAIPIEQAMNTFAEHLPQLPVARPKLGLIARWVYAPGQRQELGLQGNVSLVIENILPNTPAAQAGLQPGDTLVAFGGQSLKTPNCLHHALEMAGPKTNVRFIRDGQTIQVEVVFIQSGPKIRSGPKKDLKEKDERSAESSKEGQF